MADHQTGWNRRVSENRAMIPEPVELQPGSSARYRHLESRAEEFIRDRGGDVSESDLIAFLFGCSGPGALWAPLLQTVLAPVSNIERRADGAWSLTRPAAPAAPIALADFVALDVETTGLRPPRHRVIELALIRFRRGAEAERFETLVQPDRGVPKYIAQMTGIDDQSLSEAPRFAEIAAHV